jgi:hypothetical protein
MLLERSLRQSVRPRELLTARLSGLLSKTVLVLPMVQRSAHGDCCVHQAYCSVLVQFRDISAQRSVSEKECASAVQRLKGTVQVYKRKAVHARQAR